MDLPKLALALAIPVAALSSPACSIPADFGSTSARTSAEDSHFTLSNESAIPIVEFYIDNKSTRGKNILDKPLQPTESRRVTVVAGTPCVSNIKAVFVDGTSKKDAKVDVCELGGYTLGNGAEDSYFTLGNESAIPIVEFYIDNKSTRGKNILDQPLQPTESRRITVVAGTPCVSNIKAVFADGTSRKHAKVDVCELGGYTYDN
ncbi:hypothetical protein H6F75_13310 [Nodosilinea sp. FACHB-131]|uniref:hypothetical protein n=1 Tax=Cyanophyceae TaxID=3028117 RepID=UPI001687C5C0|nr:hypothetical protein [Nodosilinea sp. FACHB-131]MBD1874466.1 hypothetical protein [Nodosilinea sp. FACHB-131]